MGSETVVGMRAVPMRGSKVRRSVGKHQMDSDCMWERELLQKEEEKEGRLERYVGRNRNGNNGEWRRASNVK